jgi:hypothetical protein
MPDGDEDEPIPALRQDRVSMGEGVALGGTPADQNEEFADSDREFGGGPGLREYGEDDARIGEEGAVVEADLGFDETQGAEDMEGASPPHEREGIEAARADAEDED